MRTACDKARMDSMSRRKLIASTTVGSVSASFVQGSCNCRPDQSVCLEAVSRKSNLSFTTIKHSQLASQGICDAEFAKFSSSTSTSTILEYSRQAKKLWHTHLQKWTNRQQKDSIGRFAVAFNQSVLQ
jgi:hypothetical protein